MFLDKMVFSNAQALTSSTLEASTNVLDTEVAASNIGAGTPIWLVTRVNTAFSGTSGTFVVSLQNATASGGTWVTIAISATFTTAQLAAGFDLMTQPLPVDNLRYLRMAYTQATGTGYTAGSVDSFLTLNAPRN